MELLKDRNRYRMCEDSKLLEEARYNPNAELAIVLGERLEAAWVDCEEQHNEVTDHAKALEHEIDELLEQVCALEHQIDELQAFIDAQQEGEA